MESLLLGQLSISLRIDTLVKETNEQCRLVKALKSSDANTNEIESAISKIQALKKQITSIDPNHQLANTRDARKAKRWAAKQARKGKATVRATAMHAETEAAQQFAVAFAQQPSLSHRHRVFAFREFILATYELPKGSLVLDIAGGKGELSWLLVNADDIDSVVIDPRITDYTSLEKSVAWLRANPAKAAAQGCWTHQPLLAKVLSERGEVPAQPPRHLRAFVDSDMVESVTNGGGGAEWADYWATATARAEQEEFDQHQKVFGGEDSTPDYPGLIVDSTEARSVLSKPALVVGFHPDQATEACIDMALRMRVPFVVCPCCVFPSEFPDRRLSDGRTVTTHTDFITYLTKKHPAIRTADLPFQSKSGASRRTVLYMLADRPPEACHS
jgi:hypothetical protein